MGSGTRMDRIGKDFVSKRLIAVRICYRNLFLNPKLVNKLQVKLLLAKNSSAAPISKASVAKISDIFLL